MNKKKKSNKHSRPWWTLLLLFFLLSLSYFVPAYMAKLQNASYDLFHRLHPREYQPAPVRILDIDNESLAKYGQWPWPRTRIAELINKLSKMGASVIVFDMVFSEPDRTSPIELAKLWQGDEVLIQKLKALPDHDEALAKAIKQSHVVTGFLLKLDQAHSGQPIKKSSLIVSGNDPAGSLKCYPNAVPNLPLISNAAEGNGTFSFIADEDGVIRNVPLVMCLDNQLYPTITAEAMRLLQGAKNYMITTLDSEGDDSGAAEALIESVQIGSMPVSTTSTGDVWLHYTESLPLRYIHAWQILENKVNENEVKGNIIYVGISAKGLLDLRFNPFGNLIPGVEVHAQLAEQLIQNTYLYHPAWADGLIVVILILVWLFFFILHNRLNAIGLSIYTIVSIGAIVAMSWLLFTSGNLLIDPIYPSIVVSLLFLSFSIPKQWSTEREKRFLKSAFGRYISPNRVKHLIDNPDTLALGGEYRECTFVMTDLAGFTSLMEKYDPRECVAMLNSYLDDMINIAFKYNGTLDRIVGDAVAVIFSAPITQSDHHQLALKCAIEMDVFATQFSVDKNREGINFGITRIGVCTGNVLVGNFGGKAMFDYRALGDPINTAARLESVNKQLGTRICVAESTMSHCPDVLSRPVGALILKGKKDFIKTYELLTQDQYESPQVQRYLEAYQQLEQNQPQAKAVFEALYQQFPDDPLIHFHYKRLQNNESGITITMKEK